MAYRSVNRVADRFLVEFWKLPNIHAGQPMDLQAWRALNMTNPQVAQALIQSKQRIDITEEEYTGDIGGGSLSSRTSHYLPGPGQGVTWYCNSGFGFRLTFDTPEKNLQPNDVWEDLANNRIRWFPPEAEDYEKASLDEVIITRAGSQVLSVTRI